MHRIPYTARAMLIDRVLFNLHRTPPADARPADALPVPWQQVHARAIRARSSAGTAVNLLLPLGQHVRDGDVVYEDENRRIVVRIVPADMLVVRPRSLAEMGLLAAELGNLHLPLEVLDGELLTPADGPAVGVLARYAATWTVEKRVFQPLRAIALTDVSVGPGLVVRRPRPAQG